MTMNAQTTAALAAAGIDPQKALGWDLATILAVLRVLLDLFQGQKGSAAAAAHSHDPELCEALCHQIQATEIICAKLHGHP